MTHTQADKQTTKLRIDIISSVATTLHLSTQCRRRALKIEGVVAKFGPRQQHVYYYVVNSRCFHGASLAIELIVCDVSTAAEIACSSSSSNINDVMLTDTCRAGWH